MWWSAVKASLVAPQGGACVGYAGRVAIDPSDPRPLSAQITDDLRGRITAGRYAVGAKLPSLRALAKEYAVAELTVHAAVKQLQHEGVLVSTAGRGTFVRALPGEAPAAGHAEIAALREELADLRGRVEALEKAQRKG